MPFWIYICSLLRYGRVWERIIYAFSRISGIYMEKCFRQLLDGKLLKTEHQLQYILNREIGTAITYQNKMLYVMVFVRNEKSALSNHWPEKSDLSNPIKVTMCFYQLFLINYESNIRHDFGSTLGYTSVWFNSLNGCFSFKKKCTKIIDCNTAELGYFIFKRVHTIRVHTIV